MSKKQRLLTTLLITCCTTLPITTSATEYPQGATVSEDNQPKAKSLHVNELVHHKYPALHPKRKKRA